MARITKHYVAVVVLQREPEYIGVPPARVESSGYEKLWQRVTVGPHETDIEVHAASKREVRQVIKGLYPNASILSVVDAALYEDEVLNEYGPR